MARFGPLHPDIPSSFFHDFTKMALDEAKHLYVVETFPPYVMRFTLQNRRLVLSLRPG